MTYLSHAHILCGRFYVRFLHQDKGISGETKFEPEKTGGKCRRKKRDDCAAGKRAAQRRRRVDMLGNMEKDLK